MSVVEINKDIVDSKCFLRLLLDNPPNMETPIRAHHFYRAGSIGAPKKKKSIRVVFGAYIGCAKG